jgi:hypothetical protein
MPEITLPRRRAVATCRVALGSAGAELVRVTWQNGLTAADTAQLRCALHVNQHMQAQQRPIGRPCCESC